MSYLPSRKFVFVVGVAAVFAGGFFLFVGSRDVTITEENAAGGISALSLNPNTDQKDSDDDGLFDWEELLLGTDPENPDTNGDGVPDGEEFRNEKQYPELEYEELGALYGFRGEPGVSGGSNLTDSLFREAAFRYGFVSEASQGGEIDDETKEQLVGALARDFKKPAKLDKYTIRNTATMENTSVVAVNSYIANVLLAFLNNPLVQDGDPIELLNEWFEGQDENALETLSAVKDAYAKLSVEVGGITVPENLVNTHLALANVLDKSTDAIEEMSAITTDPIESMLAAAKFLSLRAERQDIVVSLTHFVDTLASQ